VDSRDLRLQERRTRPTSQRIARGVFCAAVLAFVMFVVVSFVAILRSDSSDPRPAHDQQSASDCPHGTPQACDGLLARAFGVPISSIPRFRVPAGTTYLAGAFIAVEGSTSQGLQFHDQQPDDKDYLVWVKLARTATPLRPTAGRVTASDGWFERSWLPGRDGRRYLVSNVNGHVRSYAFVIGRFQYQVQRNDGGDIATARERQVGVSLLDSIG
jgi:hypothetical protein